MTVMFINGSGDKISNLYSGLSIDVSYKVLDHLAKGFQRRRLKCKNLSDDGWQGELKR